jgi:exopolysaccharide biosynthesis protein
MKKFSLYIIIACCFALTACTQKDSVADNQAASESLLSVAQLLQIKKEQPQLPTGLELEEYPIIINDIQHDVVVITKIEPDQYNFRIVEDREQPKTIAEWQEQLSDEHIIINGSYFDEQNAPTGGLIIDHELVGGALTNDGENGYTAALQIIDNQPQILHLPNQNLDTNSQFALQSFPTLIANGEGLIKTDSHKRARRTVLAQDVHGKIIIITTKSRYFSLYEMMQYLLQSDLDIETAINLDGGPSTGLSMQFGTFNYEVPSLAVPHVLVITPQNYDTE